MKLSRLYTNHPEVFKEVDFNSGLNLVVAEIRSPENFDLDTHNLGKTTLATILDFCLLKQKSKKMFLFAHPDIFDDYIFCLEIEISASKFLTIRRPVNPGSRISFLQATESVSDALALPDESWTHLNVPFDKSKAILDGYLAIDALKPWGFRKISGYLIREQGDYGDVFQLGKFAGSHADWKPFVAHLLGIPANAVRKLYDTRTEVEALASRIDALSSEWGGSSVDMSSLDGLMAVKRREIEELTNQIDSLNFGPADSAVSAHAVDDLESKIAVMNEDRYQLQILERRLSESLSQEQILFRPKEAERLFKEAGVSFPKALKHDFDQLIKFNREISVERRDALTSQLEDTRSQLAKIERELRDANSALADSLAYLRETEALGKFRSLSNDLVKLQSDLLHLEHRREAAGRLVELRRDQRTIREELAQAENAVESAAELASSDEDSMFGRVRGYFSKIIHDVLDQDAILTVGLNASGGVEFSAEFIGESGLATDEGRGHSYKKLLCIAFDLAVLRAHLDVPFPRFVYHDGAFEQLDRRKQEKLMGVLRQYADLGLQPIASALDADLAFDVDRSWGTYVVCSMHDQGDSGRLFKLPRW